MNITEQMVCPHTVGKTHKAQVNYTMFKSRWYSADVLKFEKSHKDEYILVLNDDWSRTWAMASNPEENLNTEAKYVEYSQTNTETFGKSRRLEPGELCNYSQLYRGYIDVVSEGVADIEHTMNDRTEVINLNPVSGSLPNISIVQKTPLEAEYTIAQDYNIKFSLHKDEWARGTHYDLRVKMGANIDEWAMPVDLHNPIPDPVIAIRKTCDDPKWMTFEGEHTISGEHMTTTLLDSGTVDILNMSNDTIQLSLSGEVVNGEYTFIKDRGMWTVSGGASS